AALLGRIVTIPYFPLSDDMIREISRLQLRRIQRRVTESHGADLTYDDSVLDLIVSRCNEPESGGRVIDAILTQTMLPEISTEFLEKMIEGDVIRSVKVGAENDKFTYAFN
ncbi:MAG: type VI secretion system ATPase TssH, partial [Planctomycetota bacterium]